MKTHVMLAALGAVALAGCNGRLDAPGTLGDANSGFRYVAIDPLPVAHQGFAACPARPPNATADLLDALPDSASRVAVRNVSGQVSGGIPIFKAGVSGSTYEVVQDYISYDETHIRFEVPEETGTEAVATAGAAPQVRLLGDEERPISGKVISVPVYVGVGLRLTATVKVRKGNVNLADLGALSAAAEAEKVQGALVVQTLGLNGPKIAATIPMPGELNPTTIQNAAVALGAIKALLYAEDTQRQPRVVGIHYPFEQRDGAMINAIVRELATTPVAWAPCGGR